MVLNAAAMSAIADKQRELSVEEKAEFALLAVESHILRAAKDGAACAHIAVIGDTRTYLSKMLHALTEAGYIAEVLETRQNGVELHVVFDAARHTEAERQADLRDEVEKLGKPYGNA